MFRIVAGFVAAVLSAVVVFFPLEFIGILMTTQGKQSAPSDGWITFGSLAIGTFVGGFCFAAIARVFAREHALSLIGFYVLLFMMIVAPSMATGTHGMAIPLQLLIAAPLIAVTVAAGGALGKPRSTTQQPGGVR